MIFAFKRYCNIEEEDKRHGNVILYDMFNVGSRPQDKARQVTRLYYIHNYSYLPSFKSQFEKHVFLLHIHVYTGDIQKVRLFEERPMLLGTFLFG